MLLTWYKNLCIENYSLIVPTHYIHISHKLEFEKKKNAQNNKGLKKLSCKFYIPRHDYTSYSYNYTIPDVTYTYCTMPMSYLRF